MGELKDLVSQVENSIINILEPDGFKRKGKYGLIISSIAENSYGWLGLNRATYRTEKILIINPVIGIHNKKLMKIYDELTGYDTAKQWVATVARPLGYFMPDKYYRDWKFHVGENIEPGVEEIVWNIREYGIPWMKNLCDLGILAKAIERYSSIDDIVFILPLVWLLAGDNEMALTCADKYLEKRKHNKEFLKRYNDFIAKVKGLDPSQI